MEYRLDLGSWNAVFAVPCSLVDRHIKLAGKEHLQVILWLLRHAGEGIRPEELAGVLELSTDSVLDALDYWKASGLLTMNDGELRPAPEKQAEAPAEAAPASEKRSLPPKRRLEKPDAAYLAKRIKGSEAIRALFREAESALGVLSPAMSSVLLASVDDYGLPPEVVIMLIHYAKEIGKTGTSYIDSVARDWAESGVSSFEAAEAKLQELSEKQLAWGRVSATAGLPKRAPSKKEAEAAHRWVYEWKFSQEMLSAAYERCVDNTGKFSAAYLNKILEGWHNSGIRNPEELEQAERAKQAGSDTQKTYNIDELERLSFFNVPEDL